jgi:hypothetical protein
MMRIWQSARSEVKVESKSGYPVIETVRMSWEGECIHIIIKQSDCDNQREKYVGMCFLQYHKLIYYNN